MGVFRETVVDISLFALMIISAVVLDGLLHRLGMAAWGRWLGYAGTFLLIASFAYSARKRKLAVWGRPAKWLRFHEWLAWLGTMMILAHGGIHVNALLPWLAMASLLIASASGLTGKYLLSRARKSVAGRKAGLLAEGLDPEAVAKRLYWDALAADVMAGWRRVHMPITLAFGFLSLLHILSVLLFWRI